jgi:hypothetical protein
MSSRVSGEALLATACADRFGIKLSIANSKAGVKMNEDNFNPVTNKNLSYECSSCGQCFESLERLRQHQVDCGDDDFECL